jgi:hypothetical protein
MCAIMEPIMLLAGMGAGSTPACESVHGADSLSAAAAAAAAAWRNSVSGQAVTGVWVYSYVACEVPNTVAHSNCEMSSSPLQQQQQQQ